MGVREARIGHGTIAIIFSDGQDCAIELKARPSNRYVQSTNHVQTELPCSRGVLINFHITPIGFTIPNGKHRSVGSAQHRNPRCVVVESILVVPFAIAHSVDEFKRWCRTRPVDCAVGVRRHPACPINIGPQLLVRRKARTRSGSGSCAVSATSACPSAQPTVRFSAVTVSAQPKAGTRYGGGGGGAGSIGPPVDGIVHLVSTVPMRPVPVYGASIDLARTV